MRGLICLLFLLVLSGGALAADNPYNLEVRTLYSAPDENSNVIYNIPIQVRLLDVSADANWHKVNISFHLGPLAYTYEGWVKIPVGEILASRQERVAKTPPPEPEPVPPVEE